VKPWLVLFSLGLGACAGSASVPRSSYMNRDIRRNEILMLDGKILDYRKELGLGPRPARWLVAQLARAPVVAPPTRDGGGEVCENVCELAEYICRAQEDICRIAGELGPDDDWAKSKCWSAKASCAEAKKRCMECQPKE
jgi:hypothetical protein